MKKTLTLLTLLLWSVFMAQGQTYNQMDTDGNISQREEYGLNSNFNPNKRDSVKGAKTIPIGVRVWTVDRRFGDIQPAEIDTLPHLYQNTIYNTGVFGEYNSVGNNYTARQSRIFIDRPEIGEFFFTQPYSFTNKEPEDFLFVNTLSPYTHLTYESCGDKQHGEDHIDAKFAINANKRLGFGFDLDYHYALGYYDNQSTAHFRSTFFGAYHGDHYQMHLVGSLFHRKATENGGIVNDEYITHPESFDDTYTEEEIPTVLQKNWNRNDSQHLFLTQRYNIGFYRKEKMTDEEIKAREFAAKSASQKKKDTEKNKRQTSGRTDANTATAQPQGRPDNARIAGDEPQRNTPAIANDSTRIKVDSQQKMDSLVAAQAKQDSIEATMKKVFVPVTSLIHTLDINNHIRKYQAYDTPTGYYDATYYEQDYRNTYSADSVYDKTKYLSIKNTLALALLEGFNKYMKAGLKGYVSFDYRRYQMPDLTGDSIAYFMNHWSGHALNVGGQMARTQGDAFHFSLSAELGVTGMDAGNLLLDFSTDLNFPLFGDTLRLAANAYLHRLSPNFFMEKYHSKHFWWDTSLESETRTRIEGLFTYDKTRTQLRVAVDEIKNYSYFGMSYSLDDALNRQAMTGGIFQESSAINILTAQLRQTFKLGIIHWENVVTYQNSSNKEVLPLPTLNVFSNLFLGFKIAKVLNLELGGCVTYFSKYDAPDFLPALNQFAVQQNEDSRIELGGYPFVDVYANMHLKRARFFIAMNHINAGSGNKMQFLAPHYPMNNSTLRLGVSWNFFN